MAKTQFIATRKIIENNAIVEIKGYQMDMTEALFALRQLQNIYTKEAGWRIPHWVENRRGKILIDFEMEAEREYGGVESHVMFSMTRAQEVVRRFR